MREKSPISSGGLAFEFRMCSLNSPEIKTAVQRDRGFYDGSVAVCDDTNVVIIPHNLLTEEFYQRLENIERQEDIWFNCIDSKNMEYI